MSALHVNFLGAEFKNPIIAASGTYGFGREYNEFYNISLLGGISVKGLTKEPRNGNPAPRIAETPSGMLNCVGLQNPGIDAFIQKDLPFLREHSAVIIANVAGKTPEDYIYCAERADSAGIGMCELNISCPNVKAGGMSFGVYPEGVEAITKTVRKAYRGKLIVKLTPNVADIAENAKAAEAGGADAISLVNTFTAMSIDIRTRKPLLSNITGGLSGPAIRPIALRMVHDAYRAIKIPIIGMGGITEANHVIEFMLAGAALVEVGTANLMNPMACPEIIRGLEDYCKTQGIRSISSLTGKLECGG